MSRAPDHAEQRLYERFDLVLDEVADQIKDQIETRASALLGLQADGREIHAVQVSGRTVVVVWQPTDKAFVTFLHPSELQQRMRSMIGLKIASLPAPTPVAETAPKTIKPSKLAKQRQHQQKVSKEANWMQLQAEQGWCTRKEWVRRGRGIRVGSEATTLANPAFEGHHSKFYHESDTIDQATCNHSWELNSTGAYCVTCQAQAASGDIFR